MLQQAALPMFCIAAPTRHMPALVAAVTRFAQVWRYPGMHRAASSKALANLQLQLAFHHTTQQDSDHVSTATDNIVVPLADMECASTLSPLLPKLTHVVWARPARLLELMRQVWGGAICSTGSALTRSSLGLPAHIQPR